MADGGVDNNIIFVYLGGEQEVPFDEITHAIIDPSVNIVRRRAFIFRQQLVFVLFHDGVEIIEAEAFFCCESLSGIKLLDVREIGDRAFHSCPLSDVEFGDRLETVGIQAFSGSSLRSVKMPTVRSVEKWAFSHCKQLTEAEFDNNLESIGIGSFYNCPRLERIAIPLKDNLFPSDNDGEEYNQFDQCGNLTTVDIVGDERLHKTISSLLMESWRVGMNEELHRINRELPIAPADEKTDVIQQWIRTIIHKMEYYKAQHNRLLKEHMTQLELAIWKTKLDEKEDRSIEEGRAKKAKIDTASARNEQRVMSGADIVIRNVVPFLQLDE